MAPPARAAFWLPSAPLGGFNDERRLEGGRIFEMVSRDMLDKRIGYQQLVECGQWRPSYPSLHKLHVPWFDDRHNVIQNHRGGLDLNSNGMYPGAEPAVIEQN